MPTPLSEIEFLARSENRLAVLETVAAKPRERSELRDVTGVSQSTLARIVDELETRALIGREGYQYEITSLGELAIAGFREVSEAMATVLKLQDVIQYLPVEEFDFDLQRLQDAKITRSSRTDTIAPIQREVHYLKGCSERYQVIGTQADRLSTRNAKELAERTAICEALYTPGVFDTVKTDPEMREDIHKCIQVGGEIYLYDGDFSVRLSINDDTVGFGLNDGTGVVPAFIETDDEEVRQWAERTYDRYKREAEPLDTDAFAPQS